MGSNQDNIEHLENTHKQYTIVSYVRPDWIRIVKSPISCGISWKITDKNVA